MKIDQIPTTESLDRQIGPIALLLTAITSIIGAVVICLVIYILLQVAFIGVIPMEHLAHGWKNIEENVPGGPFAAFAAILGLQWLAMTLYVDAIVSPAGTGLAFMGATARIAATETLCVVLALHIGTRRYFLAG